MSVERPGRCWNTAGAGDPQRLRSRSPLSKVTVLASGQITAVDAVTIELVEADETPAVVIIRWPLKATVLRPRRFPAGAEAAARIFAAAAVKLAQLRRDRKL